MKNWKSFHEKDWYGLQMITVIKEDDPKMRKENQM